MALTVICNCQSRKCAEKNADGDPQLVSRATWFRHKAADLLARAFRRLDANDVDITIDPLYVPPGDIDDAAVADLETAGLFDEEPEQVLIIIDFSCECSCV